MKKIISLAIAILMVLGSLALTACDVGDVTVNIGDSQTAQDSSTDTNSSTDTSGEGGEAAQPVKVDSIKGLKVPELIDRYYKLLEFKQTFEVVNKTVETVDGKQVNSEGVVKIGKNSMYIKTVDFDVDNFEGTVEMWIVNGTLYMNQNGVKQKAEDVNFEEFVSSFAETPEKLPEQKLQAAQLYQVGNSYYFTIELNAEESAAHGYEEETHKVTFYFDANGDITKTVVTRLGFSETETFSNVGKNVIVNPPSDASSYVSAGSANVDGTVYATYEALFDKVEAARVYEMTLFSGETFLMDYMVDYAGDQSVIVDSDGVLHFMYVVDGKGYVAKGESDIVQTEYNSEMRQIFDNAKSLRSSFSQFKLPQYAMNDLDMQYFSEDSTYLITYSAKGTDNTVEVKIFFDRDMTNIEYYQTVIYDDGDVETMSYGICEIDNPYIDVYV